MVMQFLFIMMIITTRVTFYAEWTRSFLRAGDGKRRQKNEMSYGAYINIPVVSVNQLPPSKDVIVLFPVKYFAVLRKKAWQIYRITI